MLLNYSKQHTESHVFQLSSKTFVQTNSCNAQLKHVAIQGKIREYKIHLWVMGFGIVDEQFNWKLNNLVLVQRFIEKKYKIIHNHKVFWRRK